MTTAPISLPARLRAQAQALLAEADEIEALEAELANLKSAVPRDPDAPEPYLTVPDVARMFGKDERTIVRWIVNGRLRAAKFGNRYHFDPADIRDSFAAYVRRQHVRAA